MTAKLIAHLHAGVICWARQADPTAGEYGPRAILFSHGAIPDLD